mmetsp:Transcript_130269/g.416591  ORF Transcript_130269/g.416591 Transcript_130269/m.416591 type:complete len:499 (+) Transcript_130269:306-1802(+)
MACDGGGVSTSVIGEHVATYHGDDVTVSEAEGKGRILLAANELEPGERIMLEYPLVEVVANKAAPAYVILTRLLEEGHLVAAPLLFYWSALCTLTAHEVKGAKCAAWPTISLGTQLQALELHAPSASCETPTKSTQAVAAALWPEGEGPNLARFERILQVWIYNSFDQSDGDGSVGAGGVYLAASMLSHSCAPNAAWHLDEANNFNLHARADIEEGQEVTIPYLSIADLCLPIPDRRAHLQSSKDFWCSCERCTAGVDDTRVFMCPRCGGNACASSSSPEGGSTGSDASIVCGKCGSLTAAEAEPLFTAEAQLCRWARARPRFRNKRSEVEGDARSAVEVLGAAESVGLLGMHWAVDEARMAVAEEAPEEECRMLRLRAQAYKSVPFALAKYARLSLNLGRALACKGAEEEALREAVEWFSRAASVLLTLFGDDDPEHQEAAKLREGAMKQLMSSALTRGRAASTQSASGDAEDSKGSAEGQLNGRRKHKAWSPPATR